MNENKLKIILGLFADDITEAVRQRDAVFRNTGDLSLLKEANYQLVQAEDEAINKAIDSIMKVIPMI